MRKLILILVAISCLSMTGCAGHGSKLMRPVDLAQVNEAINPDEAAIVFFRPWMFQGGGLNPGIVEVDENEKLNFVAIIPNGTKYFHRTTPGKHAYFWSSASIFGGVVSHIQEADLEAGKIYYTAVFGDPEFIPITDISEESFRKKLASCQWIENTPMGQRWFTDNLASLQNKSIQARAISVGLLPPIKPEYGTGTPVH